MMRTGMAWLAVMLFGCCVQAQTPPQYVAVDLGVLPGKQISSGTAVSNSGLAAGFSTFGGSVISEAVSANGFLYTNGALTSLQSSGAFPTGVNSSGTVVGATGASAQGGFQSFLYQGGTVQSFKLTQGESDTLIVAINDAGTILGVTDPDPNGADASINSFLWNNGQVSYPSIGYAIGLSANGNIAGYGAADLIDNAFSNGVYPQTFIGGTRRDYVSPGGYYSGQAFAINSSGAAVGVVYTTNYGNGYAALFQNGSTNTLGTLPGMTNSFAVGINDSGWVVGFSGTSFNATVVTALNSISLPATGTIADTILVWPGSLFFPPSPGYKPFLWIGGKMYDLTSLVTNASDWTFNTANAINNSGEIVGTGYHNGQQRAFLLTQAQPPTVTSVVGAGLSTPAVQTLSPGALFTIFGTNFTPPGVTAGATAQNGAIGTTLGSTCVQVGTEMAPLIYVSPTQINAQVPDVSASGDVAVSVISNCGTASAVTSASTNVAVAPAAPEFFYLSENSTGQNPVAALDAKSNAYIGPTGLFSNVTTTPATAGEVLTIYATGLGATTPAQTPGTLATTAATANGTVTVTIGGVNANVLYAGVAPTYTGLYQINLVVPQLPQSVLPGNQAIQINVNGATSPAGAYLAVQ